MQSIKLRKMKRIVFVIACVLAFWWPAAMSGKVVPPVKVACVGNSITYGIGVDDPVRDSYPAQLQRLLGDKYQVGRFGRPGATLLAKGHRPYFSQPEYEEAKAFVPDIAVIHLGVNDTDPRNWPNYRDEFVGDYLKLIQSFREVNPNVRCIVARMTPIGDRHPRFISGTSQWHEQIQQAIETVAQVAGVELIDFHAPLYPFPGLLPDAIHPNVEGAGIMAKVAYAAITGDYGGLQLSELFTDRMVLQRDCPLVIGGLADTGSKVTVTIAEKMATAVADNQGKWKVVLEPLTAGTDYTLTISTPNEKQVFHDVAVGEVWLCSGQSNMEFMLKQTVDAKTTIPAAENASIRLFDMKANWRTNNVSWPVSAIDSINHLQYFKPTQWTLCTPEHAADFSAVAYHFGRMLQDSLKVPVGLICNAVGGSTTESWVDRHSLEMEFPAILKDWLHNDFIQGWARGRAAVNLKNSKEVVKRHPYEPCYLFESGILPLKQYPIKGVIWYQGESNAHNMEAHEQLFKLLVKSWRTNWNNADMPFYFVQLSSLNRPSWPWFRDSQRRLMDEIPFTGMAVSSDYGDSLDVHPRNKRPIGERLARWALAKDYHCQLLPSGPICSSAEASQNEIVVTFRYGDGLHTFDGHDLRCFELAEVDGIFYPAKAAVQGNQVHVTSDEVKHPRYVRYGWQPFTRANLVNRDGLPASTFSCRALPMKNKQAQAPQKDADRVYSTYYYQRATHFEKLGVSKKDIVFLGNSITDGAEWSELFHNRFVKNRGISGDTTWGVYDRLDAILSGKPSKIFLLIGINDIGRGRSDAYVVEGVKRIVTKIKSDAPRTKLYVQSILPVNPVYGKFNGHTSQWSRIKGINAELEKIAEEADVEFIDLYKHFADEEGKMNAKLTNDGLHLLGDGYEVWKKVLLPYID